MDEHWKTIPDFPCYTVSDKGRIKRIVGWRQRPHLTHRLLKLRTSIHGYKVVALSRDGVQYHFRVHQLVARAFIGDKPNGTEINHINFRKTDNRKENLEYLTQKQNVLHTVRNLRHAYGERFCSAKLTDKRVQKIYALLQSGCTESCVAYRFDVSRKVIYSVARRQTWKHVRLPPNPSATL